MSTDSNHYVYAYFDPRDLEMLYVGKGKGKRKYAHKPNETGSVKEQRIHEIERVGLKPLIRVIAANLTEDQALLVEKALIWQAGGSLTNVSKGHFADKFRPAKSLNRLVPGFDTARGVYYVNAGEFPPNRLWEDCRKYGYLAAGYGRQFTTQLERLEVGSIVAAYLSGHGYVGIARVLVKAVPIRDFRYNGRPLRPGMLQDPELFHNLQDDDECEWLVGVKWIKHVSHENARFRSKSGLFANPSIVASLSSQLKTLEFLEQEFKVNFEKLLSVE